MPKKSSVELSQVNSNSILSEVNAALGKSVVTLGNKLDYQVNRIPTGSLTFDRITGGGFALGRHIELYGDQSVGKSFILYKAMALSQARGKLCALIDPERTFEASWFKHLGGDPDSLMVIQPETAEDAIEAVLLLLTKPEIEIIGFDSVAALLTAEEKNKAPSEEARIASLARFMSINLRRLTNMNNNSTLIIWTNQNRTNISPMARGGSVQPGGKALKFYDTTRIEIRKGERILSSVKKASKHKMVTADEHSSSWIYVKSTKEKTAKPYLEGSFIFDHKRGVIDEITEIIHLGLEDGLLEMAGRTYTYITNEGEIISGAKAKFSKDLNSHPTAKQELISKIQENTISLSKPEINEVVDQEMETND